MKGYAKAGVAIAALSAGLTAALAWSTGGEPVVPGRITIATAATPAAAPAAMAEPAAATVIPASEPDAPVLAVTDTVDEVFHDSNTMLCGTKKVHIDGPARVFEDQFNVIHMTVSDPNATGWQWTGSVTGFTNNPKTAALDCTPVMTGNVANTNPAAFDQKTWIQAFYFDGTTAHAYGHQDYFGTRTNEAGCHDAGTTDGLPYCWYASIPVWTAQPVSSANRHLDFTKPTASPNHVAIYPHVQYPGHASTPDAGWIGYGTPSNIVRGRNPDGTLDGYWYMFAYTNSGAFNQPKGVCLFRSGNPADRTSWRAWNGSTTAPAYTQAMGNPYTTTNSACAVVQPTTIKTYLRSVVWHKPSRRYIGILSTAGAVQYMTSKDLLTWTTPQTLHSVASSKAVYPVIIDFDGGDWGDSNFDRLYDNGKAYLVFRESVVSGHTRISRRKIDVTNYAADVPGSSNPG